MALYSSWVHGHNVQLERVGSPDVRSKATAKRAFSGHSGDTVGLGDFGVAACVRIGWAARFVVFDDGSGNVAKSGRFWCHYAVPTPVVVAGRRAQADTVLVNWKSSDRTGLFVAAVHVWDANKRIFADNSPPIGDFDGGIDSRTEDAAVAPVLGQLYRGDIPRRPVFFGVGVSLLIEAKGAIDDVLEIRSVGVDFDV